MTSIYSDVNDIAKAMNFHLERQNMITANIANVDTPGYAPRELQRAHANSKSEFNLTLERTRQAHMTSPGTGPAADYEVVQEYKAVPGNDRNYVSLEHEMARLAANTIRFEAVEKLVSKQLGMIRYAASDARR